MNTRDPNRTFSQITRTLAVLLGGWALGVGCPTYGAGLLVSAAGGDEIELRDHRVEVLVEGGYARTRWVQTFYNASTAALEAVYEVPLPEEATLAEVRVVLGDRTLEGEVVRKAEAERIYGEEKAAGEDAGLATQDSFKRYQFAIARVPPQGEVALEVTYYQPVEVDTGVGVFRYPLEEGGVDEAAEAFWHRRDALTGEFSIEVEVRAGAPLAGLRAPGFEKGRVELVDVTTQRFGWNGGLDRLDRDFVLYYQLEEGLPGSVEVYAHKPSVDRPGTFMAVVTPGLDLQPLGGSDYVLVLDTSGSMRGKFGTLVEGVREALRTFSAADRFRIVLFNNEASEWTRGWISATADNVAAVSRELDAVEPGGSTNLYAGLREGVRRLDADRACSLILVTDVVANTGEVAPARFRELLARYDLRLFAFVLGNSANWPLMETICEASGGYARGVSNQQDIVGEILLAQSKAAYESFHDARFQVGGAARPYDVAGTRPRKIFRGQQLVLMGRYREGGSLELRLNGRLTGAVKSYATTIELPEVEPSRPELERLWAMRQLREWDDPAAVPALEAGELTEARVDLALTYQLVTEETAMLLLEDAQFARHGIERRNAARVAGEHAAQSLPPAPARTDAARPLTSGTRPTFGGGALDLGWLLLGGGCVMVQIFLNRKQNDEVFKN